LCNNSQQTNKQTNKLTNSKKAKEYFCHYVFCPTALSPHCGKKGYIFFTTIDHCGNELFRVIQLSNTKNSHLETPKRYYYLNPFIIKKFELHVIFAFSYFCGTFQLIFRLTFAENQLKKYYKISKVKNHAIQIFLQ